MAPAKGEGESARDPYDALVDGPGSDTHGMVANRDAWPSLRDDCPHFAAAARAEAIADDRLLEASGLGLSRRTPGRAWIHNDSGDVARVFAVEAGQLTAEVVLDAAHVFDAEDLAIAPDRDGRPWIYLADTGDNRLQRQHGVVVLRTPEPDLGSSAFRSRQAETVEQLLLTYPTGPRDVEALLVDPLREELILISKGRDGINLIFTVPLSGFGGEGRTAVVAERAGQLRLGLVTAADLSPDGQLILVRTYTDAWVWPRRPDQAVAEALSGPACKVPLVEEPQGEAAAWAADGSGYFTMSEGHGQPLRFFRRIVEPRGPGARPQPKPPLGRP